MKRYTRNELYIEIRDPQPQYFLLEGDKVIDTWTSTDKTHKIEGLKVGTEYTLREEIAPDGYVRATDIKFKGSR